ncbi:hypothetical protein CO051_02530 [Candidatus Roizmanbacteria bacterium CG_4_9_14_0_2_um_filter_39_13]|uniref:Hydrolase TatD n=2 Tax=Candidatus Roizmaniibacteriota TaxID=1752723 RepID=A0A2M8F0G6_9BACT|nr:MAG: hypothetical protein COY15_03495 [Candidatus Roizmanbacteria bacterium CG_4_10_14_0_2_um_filter_39_12]PJC32775.1 MAG: hypothetical protein CO051_02530 [Candidatus Roizmanbacteria bacterium CG_4_9_14_0_2_um_filter_39_13]PJE61307.1 MAG: hypothetical protein COU87_05275 [Candidatus Roizmanbacteria bacterium CG10_big_fil_rev_8_21_14_0_10_39_12]
MFDTHCHLNFKRFKKNLDEVISRASKAGVTKIVIPGTDVTSSKKAIEVADQHEGLYAAVGIHPHHAAKYLESSLIISPLRHNVGDPLPEGGAISRSPLKREYPKSSQARRMGAGCSEQILKLIQDDIKIIETLLIHPKVVAVGEVGMDRHVYEETKYKDYSVDERFIKIQRDLLSFQIQLAIRHKKSLILHNREAKSDVLPILEKNWDVRLVQHSVFHCCEADVELLDFAKKHDMFIGVDGDVTYDKQKQDFIKVVPLEMLVVETDSPFILPEPLKSQRKYPNEPAHIKYIIEEVARLKEMSVDEVIKITTENGEQLFSL